MSVLEVVRKPTTGTFLRTILEFGYRSGIIPEQYLMHFGEFT